MQCIAFIFVCNAYNVLHIQIYIQNIQCIAYALYVYNVLRIHMHTSIAYAYVYTVLRIHMHTMYCVYICIQSIAYT